MSYEGMKKGLDLFLFSSDSDDDHRTGKPRVLLGDQFRSKSAHQFRRRGDKVWDVSMEEKKEEESQKLIPESRSGPEEKVGDVFRSGKDSYFILDIFEKEIMELGDKVDLNFRRFKKFEAAENGDAPRDHYFYNYRCCYSSCCCVCGSFNVEKEWEILDRELNQDGFSKGVSFFVRAYKERKDLMRVAVTVGDDPSYSLFFFDIKFPVEYPHRAPSFFYHPYGLPLSTPEILKPMKNKLCYNVLDVFFHIQEIVLMNTNKSCQQMLDMMRKPLTGFEDFVKGHFRKYAPSILRNLMEEIDMKKERDRNMFWKMYIAFEDNKAYCEHLLNSDLKQELKRFKEKECSLNDYYYSSSSPYSSSPYFPTLISSRFDGIKKTSKSQNFWSKFLFFD